MAQRQAPRLLRAQGLHAPELLLSIRLACDSDILCSEGINQNLKSTEPLYGYVSSNEQEEEIGSSPEHLHRATMRDHYRRCVRERITDPENPMWREDLLRRLRRSLGKDETYRQQNVPTRTAGTLGHQNGTCSPSSLPHSHTSTSGSGEMLAFSSCDLDHWTDVEISPLASTKITTRVMRADKNVGTFLSVVRGTDRREKRLSTWTR